MTVSDIANQDLVVQSLISLFEDTTVIDRRQQPSHGYRAVHVIARCLNKMIEIQVRTSLQHLWAELSEKLSDVIDPAIKYGGGTKSTQEILKKASDLVAGQELIETVLANTLAKKSSPDSPPDKTLQEIADLHERNKQQTFKLLRDVMEHAEELKGEDDALSN